MFINGAGNNSSADYGRITGLATGMDTDNMVKQMMKGENLKVDKARQDRTRLEWQQEAYVDVIKDLKEFEKNYLDVLAPEKTNMFSSKTYSSLKGEIFDAKGQVSSNKLRVDTRAGAVPGNYKVVINNLATSAKASSHTALTKGTDKATLSTKLSELGIAESDKMTITVKDKKLKDKTFEIGMIKDDSGKFKDETLGELINRIKSIKDSSGDSLYEYANINYSELTGKFTIETKDTGESQNLSITTTSGTTDLAEKLKLIAKDKSGNEIRDFKGENSKVIITPPGETTGIEVSKSTNKFDIDGVEYNLMDKTGSEELTMNLKPNSTDQVEKIKKFVEDYNKLIDKINKKVSERREYNYKPLTEQQKSQMSKEEIEQWEQKAKQGILKGDIYLNNFTSKLRTMFYNQDSFNAAGLSLTDIGISTSNWRDGGKLTIDEDKLKDALENRGDQVQKLFTDSENGILTNVKKTVNDYSGFDGILIKKAGWEGTRWATQSILSESITKKDTAIKDMEKRLNEKQERYYQMFARLEASMNKLNSQSNWLYSQMGNM